MKLISMKMSKAEAKVDSMMGSPSINSDAPRYPYGLEIRLGKDELDKLSLIDPDVGMEVTIQAKGIVTMYRESERKGQKPDCAAEIQITDIAIEEATEAKKASASSAHFDAISRPSKDSY